VDGLKVKATQGAGIAILVILVSAGLSLGQAVYPRFANLTVVDQAGDPVENQSLVAGKVYSADFRVEISKRDPRELVLTTVLERVGDAFWVLNNYDEVEANIVDYNPSKHSVRFRFSEMEGFLLLEFTGRVPEDTCQSPAPLGEVLHKTKDTYDMLTLAAVDSEGNSVVLDRVRFSVKDQEILDVEELMREKSKVAKSAEGEFKEIYDGVLDYSRDELLEEGYTSKAEELVMLLPDSAPGSISVSVYIYAIGGLLLLVMVLGYFAYSGRQKGQLALERTKKAANSIEVILPRAQRTDKSMADELREISKDLRRISNE